MQPPGAARVGADLTKFVEWEYVGAWTGGAARPLVPPGHLRRLRSSFAPSVAVHDDLDPEVGDLSARCWCRACAEAAGDVLLTRRGVSDSPVPWCDLWNEWSSCPRIEGHQEALSEVLGGQVSFNVARRVRGASLGVLGGLAGNSRALGVSARHPTRVKALLFAVASCFGLWESASNVPSTRAS
jgi:hypothetical protein